MRVLYWAERFWPNIGGLEVLSMHLIAALQKRGYEFMVITSDDPNNLPDEEWYNGISIYRFPFLRALSTHDFGTLTVIRRHVAELKKGFKPDLTHINSVEPSVFFKQHTDSIYPTPTLITVHSPFYTSEGRLITQKAFDGNSLLGRLLNSANWVAVVSQAILRDVHQLFPEVRSRSSVIYNSLDMPGIEPTPLPFDEPCIVCLGRIVHEKGFDLALDAFGSISDRFPQARLVIAGDGPAKTGLEAQALRLGLGDKVEFIGWVHPEKIPDLINTATFVVMPSRWREPFGLVALQAAQMARPIVATRVGGLPEIVIHKQTGLLAENENSVVLAEHMTFLLQHPDIAVQLGHAARRRAREVFGMERFIDEYDALYQNLRYEKDKKRE